MNKILLVYEDYADLMAAEGVLKRAGFDVIGLSSEYAVAEQMLAFNPDLVVGAGRGGKVSSLGVGKRLKEMNRWSGKSVLIFPANFKPDPQELIRIRVDMVLESPVSPIRLVQVVGRILGHDEATLLERLNKASHAELPQRSAAGMASGRPTPEEEAIYVKGSLSEAHGDSEESILSVEEQRGNISFKFGDRVTEATKEKDTVGSKKSDETVFADVDLSALERELLGGGAPVVERVEVAPLEEIQAKAQAEVARAQSHLADRMAKYKSLVADVKVSPKSTLTRVETRRRQKKMVADWDSQSTKDLDELRRQFTKALFKK